MSDAPNNSENLGSAHADLTYKYDRKGIQQFFKDGEQAIAVHQRVQQSGKQAATSYSQKVSQGQAQAAKQTAQQVTQVQKAQIAADGKVQQARLQSTAKVESAEKSATARTSAAQIQANAKVEQQRIRSAGQIEAIEKRIAAQKAKQATSAATPLPRTVAGFAGSGLLQFAGAVGLVTTADQLIGKLGEAAVRSTELAAKANEIGPAFERSTAEAGVASDELLAKLKAASRGTVSDLQLQASANKALALEVGKDADQIADLLAIARQKGKDFGIGTAQAFEDIVTGLGRVSPLILDNLGITIDLQRTNEQYAAAIGKTAEQLTEQEKKQALVNEVLKEGRNLIKQNGDAALSDADKQAQALARQEEALTKIGQKLQPIKTGFLEGAANFLNVISGGAAEEIAKVNSSLLDTATSYEQYAARIEASNTGIRTSTAQVFESLLGIPVPDWIIGYGTDIEKLTPAQFEAAKSLQAMGESAEEAERRVAGLGDVVDQLQFYIGGGNDVIAEYEVQLLKIASAGPEYARRVREIADEFARTGDTEAFTRAIGELDLALSRQAQSATNSAQATRNKAAADTEGAEAAQKNADAQQALTDAIVDSSREIADANQRRSEQLAELDRRHAERVAELEQSARDAAAETQDAIVEAEREAAGERAEIVQQAGERITQIEEDARDRREQILQSYRDAESKREADYQREMESARLRGRESELRSTADFVERLNDLTRKGRGRGRSREERTEARRLLAEAQREAAELAKVDPEAAAQLLAARQRQILENIESKRADDQLRRDAKRGGALTSEEVQQEITEEKALRDAANAAEIEGIKQTAADKQRRREEEAAAAKANLDKQLADVEKNAEEQVAQVEQQTAKQLKKYDEGHKKRLEQIEKQGQAQQTAIAKQLAREEGEYAASQARIEAEHGKSLDRIKKQLDEKALELFYPNETRIKEIHEAYRLLAESLGVTFSNALQGTAANGIVSPGLSSPNRPQRGSGTSPAGRTYSRGSVVESQKDAVLSNEAIDQIVKGGRQSGSFNGKRGGDLHRGVDIATPLDSPVRSPIDGQIAAIGSSPAGGNYLIVEGANGDRWYFGHLNAALAKHGDQVRKGQVVARSGATGTAVTGPHVHVQLTRGGTTVDPTTSLENIVSASSASVGGRSATPTARRVGGFSTGGAQTIGSSGFLAGEPLAVPVLSLPPGSSSTSSSSSVSLTVDMRGSSYGAGVDPRDIEAAAKRGAQAVLAEYKQEEQRAIERLATSGPRR